MLVALLLIEENFYQEYPLGVITYILARLFLYLTCGPFLSCFTGTAR